jgi:hypothetical protein
MICKNCEQDFSGNFCNNCGQNSKVRKINYKYLLDEIPNSIFQINVGLLFTVKELFTRPGHTIREFIEGKRKFHFKPVAFLFLTSSLYVLFNYLIGHQTFFGDAIEGFKATGKNSESDVLDWISNNQTYIIIFILPFFSLASYLAFYKSKYNFFEHIILNLYITGQQMIIYMIFSFIVNVDRDGLIILLPLLLGFALNTWAYIQFFDKKSILKKILLIILTYIIFAAEFILGMILISGIVKFLK